MPELSDVARLERSLRRAVRVLQESNEEEITVNGARARAEEELGLDAGFFKHNPEWKERSKEIIHHAVENQDEQLSDEPEKVAPEPKAKTSAAAGRKRKSDDEQHSAGKGRAKRAHVVKLRAEDEISSEIPVELDEEEEITLQPQKKQSKETAKGATRNASGEDNTEGSIVKSSRRRALSGQYNNSVAESDEEQDSIANKAEDESEVSDVLSDVKDDEVKANVNAARPEEGDDSDMSSLIDVQPARKKRQKKDASPEKKSKSKSAAKGSRTAKPKVAAKDLSPDEEEIKRLQSWLLKCGVRKLWHRELAPYSTPNEKIRHLKKMLADIGMTGRFSAEKARQIKESRELAAELEATQEFAQRWGHSDNDDDNESDGDDSGDKPGNGTPKRRLPKGFVDFGDSGDDGSD